MYYLWGAPKYSSENKNRRAGYTTGAAVINNLDRFPEVGRAIKQGEGNRAKILFRSRKKGHVRTKATPGVIGPSSINNTKKMSYIKAS